jgi:hypothetical protein
LRRPQEKAVCGAWSIFGTFSWIDRKTGIYGIFFMRGRLPKVADNLRRAMTAIVAAN